MAGGKSLPQGWAALLAAAARHTYIYIRDEEEMRTKCCLGSFTVEAIVLENPERFRGDFDKVLFHLDYCLSCASRVLERRQWEKSWKKVAGA